MRHPVSGERYSVGIASQASANDWDDLDDDSDATGYGWDPLVETQGPSGIKVALRM